ncbi:MAG: hypothetical protein MJ160_00765 [Treponema sp.]|nr:hypothetical protein [Treponema sp.]
MITGFPSPAQGYEDKVIDLNSLMIKHPAATVFMKVDSSRYTGIGIYNGDLLIIDRALPVKKDSFVVYEYGGEFHLNQVYKLKDEILICGVITHVIHTVKNSR